MIKKLVIILIVVLCTITVNGQKWRHTWTEGVIGGGALYFDPDPGGNLINEPTDFKKLSLTISGGLGGKYSIGKHLAVGIELGLHYPLGDYLDGYSPDEKGISDIYFSTTASIGYKLNLASGTRLMK